MKNIYDGQNIYDEQFKTFYYSACMFVVTLHNIPVPVNLSQKAYMEMMSHDSSLFYKKKDKEEEKKLEDYSVYFAFLNAYHAFNRYNEYYAKYKNKDKDLDMALKCWYDTIHQDPKRLSFTADLSKTK